MLFLAPVNHATAAFKNAAMQMGLPHEERSAPGCCVWEAAILRALSTKVNANNAVSFGMRIEVLTSYSPFQTTFPEYSQPKPKYGYNGAASEETCRK